MDEGVVEERENKNSCIYCGKVLDKFVETKFGGQVFKVCNKKCEKLFIAEMIETREYNLEQAIIDLRMARRELSYKKAQLGTGVLEKNESPLYTTRSFPKDEVKPKFVLENEIDMIEFQIKKKIKIVKNMEEDDGNT